MRGQVGDRLLPASLLASVAVAGFVAAVASLGTTVLPTAAPVVVAPATAQPQVVVAATSGGSGIGIGGSAVAGAAVSRNGYSHAPASRPAAASKPRIGGAGTSASHALSPTDQPVVGAATVGAAVADPPAAGSHGRSHARKRAARRHRPPPRDAEHAHAVRAQHAHRQAHPAHVVVPD